MKIKTIQYENFRNFKDAGSIECSTDGKVTIIYGVIGAGKTTLHQLFQWIIYGKVRFNKTASDKMYNLEYEHDAAVGSNFSVKGTIDFEHAGEEYSMRREWKYQKFVFETKRLATSFTISKKDSDNNWIRLSNPEEVVEQLLPSGLADYFFFDGESMIADLKAKGKDSANSLRDAMYLMLDLSVYDKAAEYIGSTELKTTVLGTLFLSKTGMGSSAELITLGQKMESAQNKRDSLQDNLDKLDAETKKLQERIQQISEQIGGAKSQREYEQKRNEGKRRRDEYLELAKREYAYFGEELISVVPKLMISKVIEKASKKIKEQANNSKLIHGVNKELIDALLQEEVCICGNPLTGKEKEALRKLYNYLPPLGYDSLYLNFTDMAERWGKEYNREKLEGFIKRANQYLESARNEDAEIKKVDDAMKSDKQYENLVLERKKAEQAIEDYKQKSSGFVEELTKAKMLVNKCKKDIDKLSSTVSENQIIDRKIEIMEQVKQYFVGILDEKSVVYSQKLQESIQGLLNVMLETKRTVSVSKDFALRVVDSYDDESKSEGQFATVSFAYIGGIFKLLREEEILLKKEYPLVLDAPFSKLNTATRQRVIDTLPEYAPQIILFSKDDLQDCFEQDKIRKVYTIESNAEQNVAHIEEGFLWK
ncbi:MAG: AAA family ATPase [Roseburia sp.]|nr:AAA family ATPase [Roseburia sp.]